MKLYYAPGACSLAPHIVATEAGLSPELHKVDFATKKTDAGEDFTAVNPKGYVPAIVLEGGAVMTEVVAIVQYLADRAPEANLAPKPDAPDRYRMLEWLTFISAELQQRMSPLFNPQMSADARQAAIDKLAGRLDHLDKHLAENAYLLGDAFSAADAYAFTILNWAGMVQVDLASYPSIGEFMDRIGRRPKVQDTLRAEGLLEPA